jgi:type IV pilus assembly protein PilO
MRFGLRELIFFVVLLAVPVASFIYVFKPRNQEIQQAKAEIESKQAKLEKLRQVTDKISDIGAAIEKGKEAIELIEAKLPSEQDVAGILNQVTQVAERNQQVVKSIKSEKPVPAALYMELPLKMNVEGEFDGFYQFLLELENLPRITRIHQLKMQRAISPTSPVDQPLASRAMKAEFMVSIYFESQSPEPHP